MNNVNGFQFIKVYVRGSGLSSHPKPRVVLPSGEDITHLVENVTINIGKGLIKATMTMPVYIMFDSEDNDGR